MSMERVPMTIEGFKKLETELQRLKSEERPRIIQAISEARAHGDLSENAEYHAAKEAQGLNEARVAELEDKISRAEVIDTSKLSGTTIKFGATVTLVDEDTDEKVKYKIVGELEANVRGGQDLDLEPDRARADRQVEGRHRRGDDAQGPALLRDPEDRVEVAGVGRRGMRRPADDCTTAQARRAPDRASLTRRLSDACRAPPLRLSPASFALYWGARFLNAFCDPDHLRRRRLADLRSRPAILCCSAWSASCSSRPRSCSCWSPARWRTAINRRAHHGHLHRHRGSCCAAWRYSGSARVRARRRHVWPVFAILTVFGVARAFLTPGHAVAGGEPGAARGLRQRGGLEFVELCRRRVDRRPGRRRPALRHLVACAPTAAALLLCSPSRPSLITPHSEAGPEDDRPSRVDCDTLLAASATSGASRWCSARSRSTCSPCCSAARPR